MGITDVAEPRPGPDEVLIKVRASGICGTDVHILEGGFPGAYPLIPGHEFCGDVVEVGAACTRIKVGDRVAVEPNVPCNNCPECLRGEHHYCRNMIVPGVNRPGGFAEYVVDKEWGVFSVGDLGFAEGALVEPLSCVVHAIEQLAPKMGDCALVMGAGSCCSGSRPLIFCLAMVERRQCAEQLPFQHHAPNGGSGRGPDRHAEILGGRFSDPFSVVAIPSLTSGGSAAAVIGVPYQIDQHYCAYRPLVSD